jgi:hypothetical protein
MLQNCYAMSIFSKHFDINYADLGLSVCAALIDVGFPRTKLTRSALVDLSGSVTVHSAGNSSTVWDSIRDNRLRKSPTSLTVLLGVKPFLSF